MNDQYIGDEPSSDRYVECEVCLDKGLMRSAYYFCLNEEFYYLSEAVNIPGFSGVYDEDNDLINLGWDIEATPKYVRFRVPVGEKKEIYTCAECGRAIGREGFVLNTLTGECICNECDPPHQPPKCEDCINFNDTIKSFPICLCAMSVGDTQLTIYRLGFMRGENGHCKEQGYCFYPKKNKPRNGGNSYRFA